jgi:DNA-binding Xre family transcriptional regulator
MTRRELVRKSGVSYTGLKPLYDNTWKGIRRETIDAICKALSVQVGDLFEYVEMEEKPKKKTERAKSKGSKQV